MPTVKVEMPAIPVLAGMEVSGVVFLPERVTRFSEALERHLESLRRSAVAAVGGKEFNLASPDQVPRATVLFGSQNCSMATVHTSGR